MLLWSLDFVERTKDISMRSPYLAACLLLLIPITNFGKSKIEPDYGKVSGGVFESAFFKFHYALSPGWAAENDDFRMEKNRKNHEEQVKKEQAKAPKNTPNNTTTTQVFWNYELLSASSVALASGEKPSLPYLRISAMERFSMIDKAGDRANTIIRFGIGKVLKQPKEQVIAGQKFVQADFVYKDDSFEALFDTVSGKYLLTFEFRGKSEQEIDELAKTMESLKFD